METSSDPGGKIIKDVAEGATKGALNWTKDEIADLVYKFRNKELAFIGDRETIDTIKDQLKTGEWDVSTKYVNDPKHKILIQMGLTLRKLEYGKDYEKLHNLRTKIVSKYGEKGLHIAQFVQRSILTHYLASITSKIGSVSDLKFKIKETLEEMDKFVVFIQEKDDVQKTLQKIETRINAHNPSTVIIFSKNSAIRTGDKVIKLLKKTITDYSFELHTTDKGDNIYFLNKKAE